MGANPSAFAALYTALADKFDRQPKEVQKDRRKLAKRMRKVEESHDWNDDDLDCYGELLVLGLAKHCAHCQGSYTKCNADEHRHD